MKTKKDELPEKKRKSGIPTGNAGEYFVMGELLRRGFDAQLADRNTKAYDLLVGQPGDRSLRKVQVKSVRQPPWYVRKSDFEGEMHDQVTIYVMIGKEDALKPVRYFLAKNRQLKDEVATPSTWEDSPTGFMNIRSVRRFEDNWEALRKRGS